MSPDTDTMEQDRVYQLYDTNLFYSEASDWYSGTSNFPLHRPSKHYSPFERNNCMPFNNMFADRTCYTRNNTTGSHVEPELPNTPMNSQSVVMEKGVAKLKKPEETMDVPAVSLPTASVNDEPINSVPCSPPRAKPDTTSELTKNSENFIKMLRLRICQTLTSKFPNIHNHKK